VPNDEVFDFQCPKCGKRLKAGAAYAGRRVKCPQCYQAVTVPGVRAAEGPVSRPTSAAGGPVQALQRPPLSDPKPPAKPSTPAVPPAAPALASVPVASLDDDWLNLGTPAIADLPARQQVVEENKAAKERQRAENKIKQARREAAHRPAAKLDDDLPGLAPLVDPAIKPVRPAASSAEAASAGAVKRSIFDDDLPELSELQSNTTPTARSDKMLASHAGIELSDLQGLGSSPPKNAKSTQGQKSAQGPANPRQSASRPAGKLPPALPGVANKSGKLGSLYEEALRTPELAEDKDPEYRIECKSCGTAQHVRLSNKGMKIKCPDCFSEFRVPPPPVGWADKKKKPKLQLTGEDIPLSAAEEFHHGQTPDSQRSRASRILEKAEQQVSDEDLDQLYDGDFDTAGFVQRTFGFFKDPVAMAHVAVFAIVFAGVFALGQFTANITANNLDSELGRVPLLLAAIGGPILGLLFALPMLSGGLALIESVANRQARVTEWPGFNIFDHAADIAAISLALLGALVPGFLLGSWLGGEGAGAGRIQIAGMMVTTFALFPIFLLSMLDNGSAFAPLSSAVFRSLSEASEAWGGYFLKTFVAFSGVMLLWFVLLGKHEVQAAIAGSLLPLLVFFTCQQIGALADGISEQLSFEFVTPETDKDNSKVQSKEAVQVNDSSRSTMK
jgi:hypothetical protein